MPPPAPLVGREHVGQRARSGLDGCNRRPTRQPQTANRNTANPPTCSSGLGMRGTDPHRPTANPVAPIPNGQPCCNLRPANPVAPIPNRPTRCSIPPPTSDGQQEHGQPRQPVCSHPQRPTRCSIPPPTSDGQQEHGQTRQPVCSQPPKPIYIYNVYSTGQPPRLLAV